MYSFRRLRLYLLIILAVVVIGTIGMMLIEHLSLLDAFYFTIVTIATVGYGDISPVTTAGKIFSVILIVIGIGTFLTMLTNVVQGFIQRRQNTLHRHRLHMLVGVFFTEAGNRLLHTFTRYDPDIGSVRKDFIVTAQWSAADFNQLKKRLIRYEHNIDPAALELEELHPYLMEKGDFLMRQLENTDLIENEQFAELLWAIVHLRDELAARENFVNLPETDIAHLANDVKRAYSLLTMQWINYMQYLKTRYPFLFSLALRTNPFVEIPSAIVK
jgi:voltage-gated potassium channel